jgi:hypothetical protein
MTKTISPSKSESSSQTLVPPCYDKQWWDEFRENEVAEILALTKEKNSDYTGGKSCDNPFANFDGSTEFGTDPIIGVAIRMQDKFQRLKAFCKDGELAVQTKGDSVRDIYRDLIGYSLISLGMLERENGQPVDICDTINPYD